MSITKFGFVSAVATLLFATAGCYDNPVSGSAQHLLPAEKRVYLKNVGIGRLTADVVYEKGLVYDTSLWTNLSFRVSLEEFKSAGMKSVDYLNLDYNALTNVDGVVGFTALKWLRLNSNRLSGLPDISGLSDLRKIYLRNNRFASVPEILKKLPRLTDIDLSGNRQLREVPQWLAERPGLEHLSFSSTSLTRLPDDISAWKSLKTLQLGDLPLSKEEMERIRAALPDTAVVF